MYERQTTDSRVVSASRSLPVLNHPWGGRRGGGGVWGGMGAQSPAANPARMCHCRTRHAPLPAPGRSKPHSGIDLGVSIGTPIVASKAGTVVEVGNNRNYSYGCYIVIDHGNGVKTRYSHNNSNLVSVGQTVSTGQLIAYSGNTGQSTGPHLHFEIIINKVCVNPAYYIKF